MRKDGGRRVPRRLFAGWLIDGTGAPAQENALIGVEGELISSVEFPSPEELSRLEREDASGVEAYPSCTILPGLIDCHVHLSMSGKVDRELRVRQLGNGFEQNSPLIWKRLERCLGLGIMAVRDGGDVGGDTLRFVRETGYGQVRVKCAGKGWRAPGRYGKFIGRAPERGLTLAESIQADCAPVDQVKILNSGINSLEEFGRETAPQFDREELEAAFRQARNHGRKIMVHANGRRPVESGVEAGCDSIEHGFFMGEENLKRIADRQIFWVPTACTMKALGESLPAGGTQRVTTLRMLESQIEQMSRARELGVVIASGTDAGSFGVRHGLALVEELNLLAAAGFSIEETLRCATSAGAALLGLDHELGRIRPGMEASFLVAPGPPAHLPGSLSKPEAVYRKGEKINALQ
ncbi:MAG: amidohydrolase family protein [Syntrophobacteraceae bacterium]